MAGKMVLSDELLVVYENYSLEPRRYKKKYNQLMAKLKLPYETNKDQLVRAKALGLNDACYDRLLPLYAQSATKNDDLPTLAQATRLKLILTTDDNVQLPYLNIKSNLTSNELTISLSATEPRDELVKYLQMICAKATKITICDNYFANNWFNTQCLFSTVLPRHDLVIEYVETPQNLGVTLNSVEVTNQYAQSIYHGWQVTKSTLYQGSHDRYLRIESPQGNIEVMLSSGFEHIWKASPKEITCVFREI